jgi:catalase-peroxidase
MIKQVLTLSLALTGSVYAQNTSDKAAQCPMHMGIKGTNAASSGTGNADWWPNQLNLSVLRQNSNLSNPMGTNFKYAEAFKT